MGKLKRFVRRNFGIKPLNRKLDELVWAGVFSFAVKDSQWFTRQQLNPGRWAVGFPALYIIYRVLNDIRPKRILELGLGESTKLTSQYQAHFKDVELTVIEQDAEWKDVFCRDYRDMGNMVNVLPLKGIPVKGGKHNSYEGLLPAIGGRKFDFVLIDGPWGSPRDSRDQILQIIESGLLADDFVILMDDAERRGEKDTLRKVRHLFEKKNIEICYGVYRGIKDTAVICSANYRFLTTL